MRLLVSLLVIFAVAVSLGFWTNHKLAVSTGDLLENIEKIEAGIENNQWETARSHTMDLEETWDKKASWWPTVMDHQEIDNIEFAMAKVKEYIGNQNAALSWGQLSELKLMIKHIPEKEAVTIKNIL
ncbi:MAG: DUF4363 family protein [Desulfotomaculaceae bacterium]|nr:DUF4363 family protein [Desulfotomaculaceae bacterium]